MPETELLRSIEKSCQLVSRHLAERVRELDITDAEAHVLAHMVDRPPRSVQELEQALRMRRSTMTSVLDRLEDRGLVTREVNPTDRRSFVIGLTREGARTADAVREMWTGVEKAIRGAARRDDVAGFLNVVAAIEKVMG